MSASSSSSSSSSSPSSLPPNYLERVYAGVLGKIIGVYLGRPFEGWTHQRIVKELGPIHDYVHDKVGVPLVVTDDDVSGTFGFVRALEEHGARPDITAEEIGKTWLNNVVERRSVFWWGGKGISTEHTAFLNLKHGIPAPRSGSIETNGKTVAEQIGAQIFIDGWALVAPGRPDLAARLAGEAGSVSHDGESVFAAQLWAAMEAEAFVSADVDHLLDTGLRYVPRDSRIARVIAEVRAWATADGDWTKTRQRIEDSHGYDKFGGVCHVVPNHAIMVMALIYGGQDFHRAMHIINTCGWDTDCNAGNVGCLVAIMHGLAGFDHGPESPDWADWRGPVADRALISSADGGYSINNAARIALDVANMGRRLAGEQPLPAPKDGAQFHFTLPGSVQGFQAAAESTAGVRLEQAVDAAHGPGLAVRLRNLWRESGPVEVLTPTFAPKQVLQMGPVYPLMASPLVYPGQRVKATLRIAPESSAAVAVCLRLNVYNSDDDLVTVNSSAVRLDPRADTTQTLEWTIPDDMDSQPIQAIGIAISAADRPVDGCVWLDSLRWDGVPTLSLRRPAKGPSDFWKRAWVQGADVWNSFVASVCIAHDAGEGIVSYGTREWTDFSVAVSQFSVKIGGPAGVAIRVQGLNRYYAVMLRNGRSVALVKALDDKRIELASTEFEWELDAEYEVVLEAKGSTIRASVGGKELTASDDQYAGGAMGFVVTDGSLSAGTIKIGPTR